MACTHNAGHETVAMSLLLVYRQTVLYSSMTPQCLHNNIAKRKIKSPLDDNGI